MTHALAIVYLACLVVAIVALAVDEVKTRTYVAVACTASISAILLAILTLV